MPDMKNTKAEMKKHRTEVHERLISSAAADVPNLFQTYETSHQGLAEDTVIKHRELYGSNAMAQRKKTPLSKRIMQAFVNPFTAILFVLAAVSVFTDIILAEPGEANPITVIIIVVMVFVSGLLRFVQETRSEHAAKNLLGMIHTTTNIKRSSAGAQELPLSDVVVGDIIQLAAGDMIPADMRIIAGKDLYVSQSALTGESESIGKTSDATSKIYDAITEIPNLVFMGSNVISGSATGVVIATGEDTMFGEIAKSVNQKPEQTSFEKGVNSVSWLLIRFMLVMIPIVLFVNGITPKNTWMDAILFTLAVAVGLTPEMLPMIVTTCLAKGAVAMSRQKTIIKNLNSIQNLGSMSILCTDKTGTLTQDKVVLMHHTDINGQESAKVLRYAFLNSYYQTGLKNLMDIAIIQRTEEEDERHRELAALTEGFEKVDEIPFDFVRRRMSVVVSDGTRHIITKGAVEEMIGVCSYAEYNGEVVPLSDDLRQTIINKANDMNKDGMRVIAIAQKHCTSPDGTFTVADECDMILMGYLAFLDPPKESTATAIKALHDLGVGVKILTGDNDKVTGCICRQVGLPADRILLGADLEELDDKALAQIVEEVNVFAKLSPMQKSRVITALRSNGHSVGYMGDGINDASAMKASDVGISVDTAVDIAKESADVILLEKDLMVLERGIIEGRKTYANMIKYIKITASSNFGNIFSVLVASIFLPFMPMLPIHLILLNLIYDLSSTSIPWDNVDKEFLASPRKWDASSIGKFMLRIGPASSIFDVTTFALLYFVICPAVVGGQMFHQITDPADMMLFIGVFHAGWFVESMWTQMLVIHMIRTPKIPFLQSRASMPLVLLTFVGVTVVTFIPFTAFGASLSLAALPFMFFPWLILTVVLYMALVTVFKKMFIRSYGTLL